MSLQVKKALFNLITTVLIMIGYVVYTFGIHGDINLPHIEELQFWGKFMLVMMGVTISLKILSYLIFYGIMKTIHKDEDLEFMDDYDKQIELRSTRNSSHFFMIGFVGSLIPIAMGYPVHYMFITLLSFGFASGVIDDLSKLYYYKNGF